LVPTGNGDVLLLGNGSAIPQARECVLGSEVAGSLHARIGETVIITASRIKGGTDERVQLQVRVVGVLSPSGSGLKSIYVPLEVLENVERFKDGQAVPEFGWPGSIPRAYPLYNGVVLVMPKALAQEDEFALLSYSGFSRISQPGLGEIRTKTGVDVRTNGAAYLLEALYQPVSDEAVTNLGNRLRGKRAALFPWISPIRVELEEPSGRSIGPVALLSMVSAPRHGDVMAAEPLEETSDASTASLLKIMLPETLSVSSTNIVITVKTPESSLRFATTILSEHSQYDGVAFVPARLAGILKHAESRNIKFEPEEQEFVLSRRGYAGFRLYAKAINDVVELKQHLEAQGIPTSTEAQRIHDVTELDRQLALLFWMVAAIGVIGCIAALVANLYASVERKRRALAVLRLLGFSVRGLAWFPVFEGILLATGGTIVAFGFFAALSAAINALFVRHLQAGERICTLSWRHLIAIISGSLLVAVGASTLAAWRARRIEFAESLRED
jgi:putative ABC transport system permease protein